MTTEFLLLGALVFLIIANALFVAAEFSFVTADRPSVERAAATGNRRAISLLAGMRSLSTQMSGAQLGITVTSLIVGFISEPSIGALLERAFGALPFGVSPAISIILALVLATGVQAIFGELVPKNWAISEPLRVGKAVAGFQRAFTRITGPALRLLHGSSNAIVRALGVEPREELISARTPDELVSIALRSSRQGTLDNTTAQLLTRSIVFGDRTAEDVMTPRTRVVFVDSDESCAEVLSKVAATGHARFPVIAGNEDDVIGVVHFRNLLAVPVEQRGDRIVRGVMQPLAAVPGSLELDPLLVELRASPIQCALVVDEYGGTAGIVTLEDLVEEIVGEIQDEQDRPHHGVTRSSDGAWRLSGLLRPDEASEVLGVALPHGEQTETLGGLITERLGRIPRDGDTVIVTAPVIGPQEPIHLEVALTVHAMDERRVDQVRVRFVEGLS